MSDLENLKKENQELKEENEQLRIELYCHMRLTEYFEELIITVLSDKLSDKKNMESLSEIMSETVDILEKILPELEERAKQESGEGSDTE